MLPAAEDHDHEHDLDWVELAHIAIVAISAAAVWFESGSQPAASA